MKPTRPRMVMKFGGTSVASPAALERVAEITKRVKGDCVVVVSATAGTTDALIRAARAAESGDVRAAQDTLGGLAETHKNLAADTLGFESADVLKEIGDLSERTEALLQSVAILRECTPRTLDAIVSYGERISAPIVAALLEHTGTKAEALSAEGLLITDEQFGHANPMPEETRERAQHELRSRMEYGVVPVVTGFIGSTRDGVTTTLGRGGSDYSAAVLAAAIDANELLIYTDVSGVMSADPRIVKDAKPLATISYAEAAELSYFGAKVIHPRTVLPAIEAGIPVRILNTFAPSEPGTTITSASASQDGSVVKATTSIGDLGLITVQGAGMSGVPGFAARVFDTTAAERVSVMMISQSSSENSICLVVPANATDRLKTALERMFNAELRRHDVERIEVERPVAIAQGSSELNISLVVMESDREKAVRLIHEEFHR